MRPSRVKARLREGHPVLFFALHMEDPSIWEMTSLMGPDCIWLDLEHHSHSLRTAGELMRAARVGTSDVIARPAKGEFMRMQRMLECGAQGILYPRCEGPEEAREVVRWCKFAPLGERGIDGANPDMPYLSMDVAEYVKRANEETFIIIQIEDEPTSHKAEEILAIDGVDGLMLGPGDFSVIEGFPGQIDHERIWEAQQRLAAAARNTGKHWGAATGLTERAQRLIDAGARLLFSGSDFTAFKVALEDAARQWADLGIPFQPAPAWKNA